MGIVRNLSIDIETYSDVDLSKCGVYKYVEGDFHILLFAYAFDDEDVKIVDLACGEELPQEVLDAIDDPNVIKWAWNAQFERTCIGHYLGRVLSPDSWRCSMVHAASLSLPLSLKEAAKALKTGEQKDKAGENLIRYFSVPCKPTKHSCDQEALDMLKLRLQMAKSSVKKYQAADRCTCADGRARGLFQFSGANRTQRWSGRNIQLQNLPQNHISTLDEARELVKLGCFDMVESIYGNTPDILSQLIRTMLIAKPGCKFIVADFSAIEARVLAWLAGEEWRMSYTMDTFRKAVKDKMSGATTEEKPQEATSTQGTAFLNLSTTDAVAKIGKLCQADMAKSGILASISAAQFILESGYGKSELAQKANNCFGMKCSLSGNTWAGSTWDGQSKHTIETQEEYTPGEFTTITADFRKYACVEDSIADHSVYLLGAMNGSKPRYDGLKDCTDYKKAAQIIKDGGYATNSTYVDKLCNIIEKFNLTQYDAAAAQPDTGNEPVSAFPATPFTVRVLIDDLNYRSLPSMDGAVRGQTGKGVFTITDVQNGWGKLKSGAGWIYLGNPSYCTVQGAASAAPEQGTSPAAPEQPTASDLPYKVRVSISDLNIRTGPGTNYGKTGKFTGKGVFTIVEEADGQGASKWGLLKSYADKHNGWISLDYVSKV